MAKFGEIATDPKAEMEGTWETYPGTDMQFLIGRTSSPKYEAAIRTVRKKTRNRGQDELTERESKDLLAGAIAGNLLLGWKNVEAEDSTVENPKYIDFSVTAAVEKLRDPTLHDWYDWVLTKGRDGDRFRKEALAGTVGNS